jgi:hypothetical protein
MHGLDRIAKRPFDAPSFARSAAVATEVRQITDRDTWLAWRRDFVTASQIGGLPAFRAHPFYTPLRIYASMRGVEFPNDDNKILRRGRWLEPAVAKAVSELRPEWTLSAPGVFLCDPEIGIGATPDYFITGDPRGLGVLQCKTVAPSVWRREWDEGRDVPLWVTLQCLTEMHLADARFGAVAVMLVDAHAMDVQILDVPRHAAAETKLIAEVKRFIDDVRNAREPEPDFERDGAVLKLLIPREVPGTQIDLSGDNMVPKLLAHRARLMAQLKRDKERCTEIENRLRFLMGDAAIVTGLDDWGITYRTEHRKGYTVDPSEPRVLRIRDRRPEDQRPQAEDESEENE